MKLATLTSLATTMLLAASVSVLAQMGGTPMPMTGGSTSNNDDPSMNCQAMMDKADGKSLPSDLEKRATAIRERNMAKEAQAKGDEATCRAHMQTALHNMT